jgi:hypothetical protein
MSSPFDPIYGELKNQTIILRPVRFDSSDYDKEYKKPNGEYIKPVLAVTTCPQCSSPIEQEIPEDYSILNPIQIKCSVCNPVSNILERFPFTDPIKNRYIDPMKLNPEAFNDIGVILTSFDSKTRKKVDDNKTEKMNYGLSSFMNSRHSWKSKKSEQTTEKIVDIFDLLAGSIDEHPYGQSEELEL